MIKPSTLNILNILNKLAAVICSIGVISSGMAFGQAVDLKLMVDEVRQLQSQIKAAETKAHGDARIEARRVEVRKAQADYIKFATSFEPLLAAEQVMYATNSNLAEVVDARAKLYPPAIAQQEIIDAADALKRGVRWEMRIAEMKLIHPDSPFNRMVDADTNYQALLDKKEPPNVESEAVKAWMMKTPIKEVRHAILLQIPEAKHLSVQLKAWSNEFDQAESDIAKAKVQLFQVKTNMRNGDDPECQKALQKRSQALDRVSEVHNFPELKKQSDRKTELSQGIKKLAEEIAQEDPQIASLVKRRDNLQKAIMAERRRMSLLSRPGLPQK